MLPSQTYTFNEYGWLIDPVTEEGFEVAMSARGKVTEERFFDWVVDDNNATSVTYVYTYNGGSLTQMTGDDQTLSFAYDGSGSPMAVTWNGTTYLYLTNIQGDVIAILDTDGNVVVQYTYDAWGNILTTTGTLAESLGVINPLTYREYVFDQETGLYYLQSRFYNPTIGRFINADALVATGQGLLGNNMFAYCRNNPVRRVDISGAADADCMDSDGKPLSNDEVENRPGGGGVNVASNASGANNGKSYSPPKGGGGPTNTIQVNNIKVTFGHGGRHIPGGDIPKIEQGIANDVVTKPPTAGVRNEAIINYGGKDITYRYFTVSSDHINVGTYFYTVSK